MDIGKVGDRFAQLNDYALDAYYTRDEVFFQNPSLKLITRVCELNEYYAKTMYEKGHTQEFSKADSDEEEIRSSRGVDKQDASVPVEPKSRAALYSSKLSFAIPEGDEDDLDRLLSDPYTYMEPVEDGILKYIEDQYLDSRGYELAIVSLATKTPVSINIPFSSC
jgi:hypothetical protein